MNPTIHLQQVYFLQSEAFKYFFLMLICEYFRPQGCMNREQLTTLFTKVARIPDSPGVSILYSPTKHHLQHYSYSWTSVPIAEKKLFCFGAYLAIVGILCERQTTLVSWHNLSHPAVPSVKVFLRPHVKVYNGEFAKRKKFTSVRNLLSKVCKFLQRMLSRTDMG